MTLRERLWLSCRDKRCCSQYSVIITGRDLARIVSQLALPPASFTKFVDAPLDAPEGFRLDASARRHRMILDKQPSADGEAGRCVFLWSLLDGHAQCLLGAARPTICRAFPFVMYGPVLGVAESSACTCRTWALSQVEREPALALAQELEAERAEHFQAVREWNERVTETPRPHAYSEYCDFLLARHGIAAGEPAASAAGSA